MDLTPDFPGGDGNAHTETTISRIPKILPHERVFPIQIGTELFKLSGASLSSDAPSYFSQYFLCQLKAAENNGEDPGAAIRTLYIDRDPETFRDIALHLQGYHVEPRDGTHFVRLFADAQFYHLPRLISQLYDESIFISIGHRELRGLVHQPHDVFPGLEREGLIRPPSILPPSVPRRSADTFAELLHLLKGYPVHVRNDAHRAELLRDCRYFNFKGLEQRLIPHHASFNQARNKNEIVIRLEDILKSGINIPIEVPESPVNWVNYARPFVDKQAAELVLEIGGETTRLHFNSGSGPRAEFFGDVRTRAARPVDGDGRGEQPAALAREHALSDDFVSIIIEPETAIVLDGEPYVYDEGGVPNGTTSRSRSIDTFSRPAAVPPYNEWTVSRGQWRLRLHRTTNGKSQFECVLVAVKLEAVSSERGRNAARGFLNS
ncbi:unnamed protein product [Parascedosporium putredinis]|uniref:BTB/POZ domain-containing protein n=1 Tax=Parascedosporium putredinis TaxID=1442378 RepID=A0A9P1H706_9PEZI|nr:unnamed protein product [Parascedosporium putredinis]CAI7999390.1 unnamed protein product [Parascedosporium putredinis]